MKAIILAAGRGTRLAPVSDNLPKAMVSVNGKPILVKQIENLVENGVTEIGIVTGYKSEFITDMISRDFPYVTILFNNNYLNTNNMYSAYLFKEWVNGSEFILMNGDVYFDSEIIATLLEHPIENMIATDIGVYYGESMKVVEREGLLRAISKEISPETALGVSIDLYKLSGSAGKAFFGKCREYIYEKQELNLWMEVAINDILASHPFVALPVSGKWYEIDTLEDLAEAEKLFAI